MSTLPDKAWKWLTDRYPVEKALALIPAKQVPIHSRSIWYMTGSIPLILFGVQVFTGILLMTYYSPGMDTSHASVSRIMNEVQFGWLIRSVHSWAANFMVAAIFAHMFAKLFTRAWRKPRELTWLTGVGLLGTAYAFGFFGYLLPWDQLAYFATVVGLNSAHAIPVIGTDLVHYIQGGEAFNDITLSRFYTVHVMVLPITLVALLSAHLAFLQVQGESVPDFYAKLPEDQKKSVSFFPDFTVRELGLHFAVLSLLVIIATLFPWHLGLEADPLMSAPVGIKPEWYFWAQFQILRLMPASFLGIGGELLGLIAIGAVASTLIFVPFWDPKGKHTRWFGIVFVVFFLVFTYLGWAID